ncbi:MAG: site-specific integrase, partial [Candidatus Methanomethylicus sp.]|nr:site-specific integrase [Candidatus Methanomethylicus sp.]
VGWKSEGFSLEGAQAVRAERMKAIRQGQNVKILSGPKKAPLFKELAEAYIQWARENKAGGARDDISRYHKHLAPRFNHLRIDEISALALEKMKGELRRQGLSLGSIEHCLKLFRQIINKAKLWGLYEGENPIKGVKIPNAQNGRIRFLSYDEARKLLEELEKVSLQVHDMALISLHTGMRAGEIFNMKVYDIDLKNCIIDIPDSKNKQSRKAFMTEGVKAILRGRANGKPMDYVFKSSKGGRVMEVSDSFARVVERLGFNEGIQDRRYKITFHSLRHTFASWLALQGEALLTIKELLGHKSLEMTLRYAHLMPDQKRDAVARMERALGGDRANAYRQNANYKSFSNGD